MGDVALFLQSHKKKCDVTQKGLLLLLLWLGFGTYLLSSIKAFDRTLKQCMHFMQSELSLHDDYQRECSGLHSIRFY